jgi:hypothetical protein
MEFERGGIRLSTTDSRSASAKHLFCRKEREANFPKQTRGSSGLLHHLVHPLRWLVPATARRGRGGSRLCDGPRAACRAAARVFIGEESSRPPVPRPRAQGGGGVLRCSTIVGKIRWRRVEAGGELCHQVRSRKPPPLLFSMAHPRPPREEHRRRPCSHKLPHRRRPFSHKLVLEVCAAIRNLLMSRSSAPWGSSSSPVEAPAGESRVQSRGEGRRRWSGTRTHTRRRRSRTTVTTPRVGESA